jgi:hypothetical protein
LSDLEIPAPDTGWDAEMAAMEAAVAEDPAPAGPTHWVRRGYAVGGIFEGAWACSFRLTDERSDRRIVVQTLGHQKQRGGGITPIIGGAPGFHFVTFVASFEPGAKEGEVKVVVVERSACNDPQAAEAAHAAALAAWLHKEPGDAWIRKDAKEAPPERRRTATAAEGTADR